MTQIPVFQKSYYLRLSAKICVLFLLFTSPSFGFQATFTPRISVNEEYTDNLFLSDKNTEHDYITTVSPGFTAEILGKNNGASISYSPSHSFYDRYSEKDSWRHNARFSGWAELSKNTRLDISNSFLRTEDPLTDADIVDSQVEDETVQIDNTIRKSRNTYYTNSAAVNLTHKFGETDSFKLGYVHSILENDDETIEDNVMHNPSMGLTYWFIPGQLGLETNASYRSGELEISDDFDNWKGSAKLIKSFTRHFKGFVQYAHVYMDYQGDGENYQIYDPSIGIDYTIDKDTHLSFSVGYFYQDRVKSKDESGTSINGELGKSWIFKRGSINLTGSSGYDETYFGAENLGFDIFYQAQCNASYGLTKHISSNISGSYRRDKYVNLATERKDNTSIAGMGLTFQPLPWMSVGLNYTYRSVDSTLDENDYVENKGLISITLSPSIPFRTSQH